MHPAQGPVSSGAGATTWALDATNLDNAWVALRAALRWLSEKNLDVDLASARIVLTELVGNAVRHGGGHGEIVVEAAATGIVVHVTDGGAGCECEPCLPPDPFSEGGRGLYLVREYTRAFAMRVRDGGGCHAIATLRGRDDP